MDFDFITQLYYENINPNVRDMPRDFALGRVSKAFAEAEEELTNTLTGEEKKMLLNLLNSHSEIIGTDGFDNFCTGFRLGALAILDILVGSGPALQLNQNPGSGEQAKRSVLRCLYSYIEQRKRFVDLDACKNYNISS